MPVMSTCLQLDERFSSDELEKRTHKELCVLAEELGVNHQAMNDDEKRAFPMSRIIADMVQVEENKVKQKVMTKVGRRKLGIGYHRYSHFVNLHDALATCVHPKDRKKLPEPPVKHHVSPAAICRCLWCIFSRRHSGA
jgi:hypothetical protein